MTESAASSSTGVSATPTVPDTRAVVSFLVPHARGAWHWFAGQAALDVLSIVVGLATPALAAVAIDQAIEGRIDWGFFLLAAAMALSWLIGVAAPPVATRFGIALGRSLTQRSMDHALEIGLPGRRPFDDGDLLLRAALAPGLTGYVTVMLRAGTGLVMAVGSLVALAAIHWLFVLVLAAVVGLLAFVVRQLVTVLTAEQSEYETLRAGMVNAYTDALTGRRTIRAAGTLEREIERVTKPLGALVATGRTILRTLGRGAVTLASADYGVLVVAAAAGVWLLAVDELTAGAMLAAVRYSQMAYSNVGSVFDNGWFQIAPLRAQAAKVMELFAVPPANPVGDARHRDGDAGEVTFQDVAVRGDGERNILDDVNLDIPRGTTIAVVGRSGVGKTTLGALVGRLFDPDAGEVRLSGAPLVGWQAQTLAQTVAYAFEKPALLGDTVRDAIALGRDVDDEDVRSAAQSVEAHGFIARLPQGYQTPLQDAPMSGGELQRLGLARAALGNAPVLVLDDALSSLDVATAARVFAALRSLSAARTTVVIAHRASTAAAADVVAWLVDGRIARLAPHDELWLDPAYRGAFVATGTEGESAEAAR